MKITVLLGFAEALAAPEVVWSLVDHGIRVVAFARRGRRCALRYSRHVACHEITSPDQDVKASLAELRALMTSCREGDDAEVHVLLPLDDNAVWLSDQMAGEDGWILAGPCGPHRELALNKHRQIEAARKAGFNVARTRLATRASDIPEDEPMPLMLRPSRAVWQADDHLEKGGMWVCEERRDLEAAFDAVPGDVPLLVQPYIVGRGEGVFGLALPDGRVVVWSGHRRVRMMNPHGSGSSACQEQAVTDDLRGPAERLIRDTGWQGMFMVELLRDQEGTPWFVEFNGRAWGSMALARRRGFEYPFWHVRQAVDPNIPAPSVTPKLPGLLCRHFGRELMHLLFVLRGPKFRAVKEWPSFWRSLRDVFFIRPRDAFYNWRKDDLKVFLIDCYLTIHSNVFKSRR